MWLQGGAAQRGPGAVRQTRDRCPCTSICLVYKVRLVASTGIARRMASQKVMTEWYISGGFWGFCAF